MKGAFDPDCRVDCSRIAGPQLKFYIGDYGNKNNARRKKKHNSLQSLWDTLELPPSVKEEERKKSLPQCRADCQQSIGLFSHPSYNAALTLLKWDHVLCLGDPLHYSLTHQNPVKKEKFNCSVHPSRIHTIIIFWLKHKQMFKLHNL